MDEFKISESKEKHLNEHIIKFRNENPSYEIFNICFFSDGLAYGYKIIWKRIKKS